MVTCGWRLRVRIISRRTLREYWEKHPGARQSLEDWYDITKKVRWANLAETRRYFPHADPYGSCTIFNIKGNDYRLITKISYEWQIVYIRFVLTHSEYDKDKWKNDCR
jgi:mRNA interferase HigB